MKEDVPLKTQERRLKERLERDYFLAEIRRDPASSHVWQPSYAMTYKTVVALGVLSCPFYIDHSERQMSERSRVEISQAIDAAPAFWWTGGFVAAAADLQVPEHTFALSCDQSQFWQFHTPLGIVGPDGSRIGTAYMSRDIDLAAMLVWDCEFDAELGRTRMLIGLTARSGDGRLELGAHIIGLLRQGVASRDRLYGHMSLCLSLEACIASPHLKKNLVYLPRAIRRRIERDGCAAPPPVTVVTIPGRTAGHSSPEAAGSVEWACQWLVRGHVRAQWYPSINAHRLLYIAPHVKGPDDKPLKPKTYAARIAS